MKKKMVSWLILVVMLFNFGTGYAGAEGDNLDVTVYVSISLNGAFVNSAEEAAVVAVPIELTGETSYNVDDVLRAAHESFYEGGAAAGYDSSVGDYGLYVTKLWGNTSGWFGYQVNGGREVVTDLTHELSDGDYLEAYVFENNELYTFFNAIASTVFVDDALVLTLSQNGYDADWNMVVSPCVDATISINGTVTDITTDAEGKATVSFDTPGTYVISAQKTVAAGETISAIVPPVAVVTVTDTKITVPSDSQLWVGQKDYSGYNYKPFTTLEPVTVLHDETEGTSTYYYEIEDEKDCNYHISGVDYITYAGTFNTIDAFELVVTEEELCLGGKTKTTVDRDTASHNGSNVADVFLNINPQGYLKLDGVGDTHQLVNLRNWQMVVGENNYFLEPDYHYTVLNEDGQEDSSVINVSDDGLITAVGNGTAIVLVTYDAMLAPDAEGETFLGAIWPENTGVFMVSVGAGDSGIVTGMTINEGMNTENVKLSGDALDAEHDVIYFVGDNGFYTFAPETEGCTVSVANPIIATVMSFEGFETVAENDDGSFTVPLTEGRNIVKLEKDGEAEYQIITAKEVTITVNNGEEVHPGDALTIVFNELYHPANKLAGVYNMSAAIVYHMVDGYTDEQVGAPSSQYTFASSETAQTVNAVLKPAEGWMPGFEAERPLTVPADYEEETLTLSGGVIAALGYGSLYGSHRFITPTEGVSPDFNADAYTAYFGRLPDVEIVITPAESEEEEDTGRDDTDFGGHSSFPGVIGAVSKENKQTTQATMFTDVHKDAWYYESVKTVTEKKWMNGVEENLFAPDMSMNRGMLVTVLFRLAGEPEAESPAFSDVLPASYYAGAVAWASRQGIVYGVGDNCFAPENQLTREQIGTMLYRYCMYQNYDVNQKGALTAYEDGHQVSEWAEEALSWACGIGIINGRDDGTLAPKAMASRAEIAAMLTRLGNIYIG